MKICFVGVGSIGKRHIRNLTVLSRRKGFVLEIDALRSRNNLLGEVGDIISNQYFNVSELKNTYDAIFITNPTNQHYVTLKNLKNYSKNFFVEKPIFGSLEERIEDLKLPDGNQYYVACPLRYNKVLIAAEEFIKSHKVYTARAISSSYLPEWRPGQDYRQTYSARKSMGGGVCIDLIHEWDYLIQMFGKPEQVQMMCGKISALEIDSEDIAVYIARYPGMFLELHLDYFGRMPERKLELYCEDGKYEFDILHGEIRKNGILLQKFEEDVNEKYLREMEYFLELIEGKKQNTNNLEQAIEAMKIALGFC